MMADLISRAAAIRVSDRADYRGLTVEDVRKVTDVVSSALRELPAVDAAPVVHARWVENEDCNGDPYYTCSACGETWVLIDGTPSDNNMDYCPRCGAKMDKEAGE